jgi:hypothetical protein
MSRNGLVRREGSKPAGTSLMASLTVPHAGGTFMMILAIITFLGGGRAA